MMKNLRQLRLALGALALIGSLFLIFHLHHITTALDQGPSRNIVMIWQLPYGLLGFIVFCIGAFLFFGGLPKQVRLLSLGIFLSVISLLLAAAFCFNNYHGWWWKTSLFTFFFGIGSALAGGFLIGRKIKGLQKVPRWAPFLTLPLFAGVAYLIMWSGLNEAGYYDYSNLNSSPYPWYVSYSGDYLYKPLAIAAFQIFTIIGLYLSLSIGFCSRRKKDTQPGDQSSAETGGVSNKKYLRP